MYLPPLSAENEYISSWDYRRSLIQDRIGLVDAGIVCFQEVSPLTFEDDFGFMTEHLGYDGVELFHKVIVMACILKMSSTLYSIYKNDHLPITSYPLRGRNMIRVVSVPLLFGRKAEWN